MCYYGSWLWVQPEKQLYIQPPPPINKYLHKQERPWTEKQQQQKSVISFVPWYHCLAALQCHPSSLIPSCQTQLPGRGHHWVECQSFPLCWYDQPAKSHMERHGIMRTVCTSDFYASVFQAHCFPVHDNCSEPSGPLRLDQRTDSDHKCSFYSSLHL